MLGSRALVVLAVLVGCNGDGGDPGTGDELSCHVPVGEASDYEQCAEYVGLDEAGVTAACDVFPGEVEHNLCSQEGAIGVCELADGGTITYYEDSAGQYPESVCAAVGGTWVAST